MVDKESKVGNGLRQRLGAVPPPPWYEKLVHWLDKPERVLPFVGLIGVGVGAGVTYLIMKKK